MKKALLVVTLLLVLLMAVALSSLPPAHSKTGRYPMQKTNLAAGQVPLMKTPNPATVAPHAEAVTPSGETGQPLRFPTEPIGREELPTHPTTVMWVWHPPGEVLAPILLYHHVGGESKSKRYQVSVEDFDAQMHSLKAKGYTAIPLSLLVEALSEGADLPPKPVVITFDDGYRDIFENALPVLQQDGFTATVYVIVGQVGLKSYLSAGQLKELVLQGWEVGSHTYTHASLRKVGVNLKREIETSRQDLQELLGTSVLSFSFPYGLTSNSVTDLVKEAGYESAVGLGGLVKQKKKYIYYLSRIEVQGSYDLDDFNHLFP